MLRQKLFTSALLVFLTGSVSFGQKPPLEAKIASAETEVKVNQTFSVSVAVRNISSEEQVLSFLTCGGAIKWYVDNPLVRPHTEGFWKKLEQLRIEVRPGEVLEKTFQAYVEIPEGEKVPESVTFRLELFYLNHEKPKGERLLSNAATIKVTR